MTTTELFVAEKWFSRGYDGTNTYKIDAELVKKAIELRSVEDDDIVSEWLEGIDREDLGLPFSAILMLSEIARGGWAFDPNAEYKYDDVVTEDGLGVETEEQLFGIGATKGAAKAALMRLLAGDLNEGGW
jgi:hypothetical protein